MIILYWKYYDYLKKFRPLTEDEELLLTLVEEKKLHPDLIEYSRSMKLTPELRKYLDDDEDLLEALSYHMYAKFILAEKDKENELIQNVSKLRKPLSFAEKRILAGIKRMEI